MSKILLPLGTIMTDVEAPPRVELHCASHMRRSLHNWFDRLGALGLPWLSLPATIADSPVGLVLDYPTSLRRSRPLPAQVAQWSQDPATAVPRVLELARFTVVAAEELARHRADEVPVCPGLIFSQGSAAAEWRLIALPFGTATLADWSKADAAAWAWAAPDAMVAGRTSSPAFALGAALHYGLLGAIYPELLCRHEQFARLLRGRLGMPARLKSILQAAIPPRCQSDGADLMKLTIECLDGGVSRGTIEPEARTRLEALIVRLSANRLARAWEQDNRLDIASKMREQYGAPTQELEEPILPPPGNKDWIDLAREHLDRRDVPAALAIAWGGLVSEGSHKADLFLMIVQRGAAILTARSELVASLNRLLKAYPASTLGELNMLRVAHIKLRYLAAAEPEVMPMLGASQTEWGRGVGLLLRAVFAARKSGAYIETSRLCSAAAKDFAGMPQQGGVAGKYGRAYVALLDGIAHVGFVASGGPADYYTDALDRFGTALELATEIGAGELRFAAAHWLRWMKWLAGLSAGRSASTIGSAIDVVLRLRGEAPSESGVMDPPEVPAYDERFLFPV